VHGNHLQHPNLAGLGVYGHLGKLRRERVVVARRKGRLADDGARRPAARRRQQLLECERLFGCTLAADHAIPNLKIRGRCLQVLGRQGKQLLLRLSRRALGCAAGNESSAAGVGSDVVRRHVGVARHDPDVLEGDAQFLGRNLGQHGFGAGSRSAEPTNNCAVPSSLMLTMAPAASFTAG